MTRLASFLLKLYVLGILVQVAPTVYAAWDAIPASQLYANVVGELPEAATWPARAYKAVRT